MLEFSCDTCGQSLYCEDADAGKVFSCSTCSAQIRAPQLPGNSLKERSPILRAAGALAEEISTIRSRRSSETYPWLRGYIGWLRFWGYVGNAIVALWILGTLLAMLGELPFAEGVISILAAIWTAFGFNFLFVIAELVRLTLDAKAELSQLLQAAKDARTE